MTAAEAAVKVAARLGVRCTDPVILADGANVIVYLSPAPVVAKVTPAVRPEPAAWRGRRPAWWPPRPPPWPQRTPG